MQIQQKILDRFTGSINIQMICIHRGYARNIGMQMQKRTIKFICFNNSYRFAFLSNSNYNQYRR
jgi:hypothetical protein